MTFVAVVGAGDLGAAIAARLAGRDRAGDVRLIDPAGAGGAQGSIAAGKSLDIQQSAPVEGFRARVTADSDPRAVAGAEVAVIADTAPASKEWDGEEGLALLRQLWPLVERDVTAIVCAGAAQRLLVERGIAELGIDPRRICGSAPGALESAVRALVALEVDGAPDDVHLEMMGVPPRGAVVAWSAATVRGAPVTDMVPAHRVLAIDARLPALWPPGPYALASAAARVVEALVAGSRRRYTCFTATQGRVVALPVRLGVGRIESVLVPSLSPQERTAFETALDRAGGAGL